METSAVVTLAQVEGEYAITAVRLTLKAKIPGAPKRHALWSTKT
jgi:lipoyl-dependent peroxiredoxin